ncbi:MAG: 4-alpha-glucanotransferase, partial [Clostridiales bacterium]|nr:4-alpha-glucanotransferase [Clostridiales bacterium]
TQAEKDNAVQQLGMKPGDDIVDALINAVFNSPAQTVIIPMQDILKLDGQARMNLPGTLGGNWQWRMSPIALTEKLTQRLLDLNRQHERGDSQ